MIRVAKAALTVMALLCSASALALDWEAGTRLTLVTSDGATVVGVGEVSESELVLTLAHGFSGFAVLVLEGPDGRLSTLDVVVGSNGTVLLNDGGNFAEMRQQVGGEGLAYRLEVDGAPQVAQESVETAGPAAGAAGGGEADEGSTATTPVETGRDRAAEVAGEIPAAAASERAREAVGQSPAGGAGGLSVEGAVEGSVEGVGDTVVDPIVPTDGDDSGPGEASQEGNDGRARGAPQQGEAAVGAAAGSSATDLGSEVGGEVSGPALGGDVGRGNGSDAGGRGPDGRD